MSSNLFNTASLFTGIFSADPELFDQIEQARSTWLKIEEQHRIEREERLRKEREMYKYGFQEIEDIQSVVGKNVFIECKSSKFGYLTYDGEVIDKNFILEFQNPVFMLDELNNELINNKRFRFITVVDITPISDTVKKHYQEYDKDRIKGKTKIISGKRYIFDVQNHKFMFATGSRFSDGYIFDNILKCDSKYIFIPTNTVVIDTSHSFSVAKKNKEDNKPNIYDSSSIQTDKYLIFKATKWGDTFKERIDTAYKLNKFTGEFTEIV